MVGRVTGNYLTEADENTGVGKYALYKASTGSWNVAIGEEALYDVTTGNGKSLINSSKVRNAWTCH